MTLVEESDMVIATIKASTKGSFRALAVGVVPILQFGLVIALAALVVSLPLKMLKRGA